MQISQVVPLEDYRLEVHLTNGSSIILYVQSRLETARFALLADEIFFRQANTDGSYIRWHNKVEISVSEVFQLAQK